MPEKALRDAEEFLRRLVASSHDCIKVLDLEGRLLWMNEGGMQALEICELGPFVNTSWIEFWEGEDARAAQAAVEAARKGGTSRFTGYCATMATKQPRWWDVVVSPIRNPEGKAERLLAVSRDVTEHKRNEKGLREAHLQVAQSEERWRSVFENSAIGVALTDLDGRFLATNPVYQEMVGYSEEELRELSFLDITHADYLDANGALIAELLKGNRKQLPMRPSRRRSITIQARGTSSAVISGTCGRPGSASAIRPLSRRRRPHSIRRRNRRLHSRRSSNALPPGGNLQDGPRHDGRGEFTAPGSWP